MTVREAKSLLAALPDGSDDLELSAICCLCDCETFLGSAPQIVGPDADRPAGAPGNVLRVVLK